jgi:hypothetical protein
MTPEKCKEGYREMKGRCIKIEKRGSFSKIFNAKTMTILLIALLIIGTIGGIVFTR